MQITAMPPCRCCTRLPACLQLELAEFDEPGSHLYFGKRGELFQYTYVGRQAVISGFTSLVFAGRFTQSSPGGRGGGAARLRPPTPLLHPSTGAFCLCSAQCCPAQPPGLTPLPILLTLPADELERARSAAAEERLPRKQQQQSDRSWAAFLAHFQSSGAWPAPNLPFLFAGRVVDAEAAGVHVLKRAAR